MDDYGNCPKNTQCQYGKSHEICCSAASESAFIQSPMRRFPVRLLKVITPHNSLPLEWDLPLVMRLFLLLISEEKQRECHLCSPGCKHVSPAFHVRSFPDVQSYGFLSLTYVTPSLSICPPCSILPAFN